MWEEFENSYSSDSKLGKLGSSYANPTLPKAFPNLDKAESDSR